MSRIPVWLTILAAVVAALIVVAVSAILLAPSQPLILNASFRPEAITPNADGSDDVTEFSYSLSRNAQVSIAFEHPDGRVFAFRQNERRAPDDYRVQFSGVVDGYVNEDEGVDGTILRRLIPDGEYTWRLRAVTEDGEIDERTGIFRISEGDAPLPRIATFTILPQIFTPNQDGIGDRTAINVFITKDADLTVYLEGPDGEQFVIPERIEDTRIGEAGMHTFDYEGGVDRNADPPPDGTYRVIARTQDSVGQSMEMSQELTIQLGGKPYGQIVPQPVGATVVFDTIPWSDAYRTTREQMGELVVPPTSPDSLNLNALTIPLGDVLVFKLTVQNVGNVPLRTTGPMPGTVYEWDQRAATLGHFDESGAWRVGIDCQTAISDYPWRWAIGTPNNLIPLTDPITDEVNLYLSPGETSVVWGAIRMNEIEARNPQNCWAGLIHEDVNIAPVNNNVGPRSIELVVP
jgi:hypothetical protein